MKNMDKGQGTHFTKMVADSLARNHMPNLSPQAQNFGISMKIHWASVVGNIGDHD